MASEGARKHALILDDDRVVADSLGMILSGSGYEIRVAYSAEAAVELLAHWSPDIAIVDILLPGMNGVDFAILLQTASPGCHVLLFTAFPAIQGILEGARGQGYDWEIFEKPVPPPAIVGRVAELLAGGARLAPPARVV